MYQYKLVSYTMKNAFHTFTYIMYFPFDINYVTDSMSVKIYGRWINMNEWESYNRNKQQNKELEKGTN